jgi:hypothetical protein
MALATYTRTTIGAADLPTLALQLPSNAKVRLRQILRKTPSLILSSRVGPLLIALDMEGEVYSCGSATVGHETPLADLPHDSLQVCRYRISQMFTPHLVDLAGRGCCRSSSTLQARPSRRVRCLPRVCHRCCRRWFTLPS